MRIWLSCLAMMVVMTTCACSLAAQELQPLGFGDSFPELRLKAPVEQAARNYLGLGKAADFSLSQLGGELVLVELLNVHCPHCQMQTPSKPRACARR